uniref:Preprotein translocase SecG subunit n=1 Tax=Lithodesmioides polymorpha TaxID=1003075 RepID=UPI0022391373|nr:Preprotein translocase SecG subunit [Lithodesmioides polymorpha]UYC30939.1 Preprotein translocase SecG subunit [Lithodesmioides polymorpha]
MLKLIWLLLSGFLIFIIFLRAPQNSGGLAGFASKSNVLGSPSSAEKTLNNLTAIGIFLYFIIAIKLNF